MKEKIDNQNTWIKEIKRELDEYNKNPKVCPHCGRCPVCGRKYNEWPYYPPVKWENEPIIYFYTSGSSH